jgi:hypothetical protein
VTGGLLSSEKTISLLGSCLTANQFIARGAGKHSKLNEVVSGMVMLS